MHSAFVILVCIFTCCWHAAISSRWDNDHFSISINLFLCLLGFTATGFHSWSEWHLFDKMLLMLNNNFFSIEPCFSYLYIYLPICFLMTRWPWKLWPVTRPSAGATSRTIPLRMLTARSPPRATWVCLLQLDIRGETRMTGWDFSAFHLHGFICFLAACTLWRHGAGVSVLASGPANSSHGRLVEGAGDRLLQNNEEHASLNLSAHSLHVSPRSGLQGSQRVSSSWGAALHRGWKSPGRHQPRQAALPRIGEHRWNLSVWQPAVTCP